MKELVYPRVLLPAMENHAGKMAFFDGAYENTMAGHGDRVLRLGDAMRNELGLEPGDRFAVMALNSHEFLELYHAGFLGAGVITPLNLRLAGAELLHIVRDSGSRVVFVDAMFAEHLDRALAEAEGDLDLEHVVLIGDAPYVSLRNVVNVSGVKSGWSSTMAIMVGTITVCVTVRASMRSSTAPAPNIGTKTDVPPTAGMPSTPVIEAAWNIGVWWRYTACSGSPSTTPAW